MNTEHITPTESVARTLHDIVREKSDKIAALQKRVKELEGTWQSTPPTEQGWYWHWNGSDECTPLPISVLWSGTDRKCFVARGQLGLDHAIDCDKYGGFWMRMATPSTAIAALLKEETR